MSATRAERVLLALSAGCAAAVLVYPALRLAEHAFFPESDPALLVWSERSRFAWRAILAAYFGGAGAFGAAALARRAPRLAARGLPLLTAAAALALAAQAALLP